MPVVKHETLPIRAESDVVVVRQTIRKGATASSPGPGQGSEFVVTLPLVAAAAAPQPGRRILVVDDNRDAADSLATLLRLFGNDVRSAYDGRQALAVAATYRPGLIFLDLGLPGMSGIEVAKQLRNIEGLAGVTIVALTGYGTDLDRRRSQQAGFNAHFVKPIDFAALQDLLRDPAL